MLYNVVPLSNTEIIEIQPLTQIARIKPVKDVMQFTGLLDMNGKEIYEGDIVTALDMVPDVVIFKDGVFTFKGCELSVMGALNWFNKLIIIGNIYEHPHLLSAIPSTEKPDQTGEVKS